MTLQESEKMISAIYGEECCGQQDTDITLEELDESIQECKAMLDYVIDISDQEEISFWRKMLQRAKVERRELLNT